MWSRSIPTIPHISRARTILQPRLSPRFRLNSVLEHHRPVAVHEYPVLKLPMHRLRQHPALDIAALAHKIFGAVGVTDPGDILVADRPFVVFGDRKSVVYGKLGLSSVTLCGRPL